MAFRFLAALLLWLAPGLALADAVNVVVGPTRWAPGASGCNALGPSGGATTTTGCILPYTGSVTPASVAGQLAEPCVLPDDTDPANKLVMYLTVFGNSFGQSSVTRLDGVVSNPQTGWTNPRVVIPIPGPGPLDSVRIGSCNYVPGTPGTYYIYWGHIFDNNSPTVINLSTSTDHGVTFTPYAGNPILTASADETQVEDPMVWQEGGQWTMLYAYRTTGGLILPGYRVATSTDGRAWTKTGAQAWTCDAGLYCEAHRMFKYGSTYLLVWEQGNTSVQFANYMAEGPSPSGPFTAYSGNPLLPHGAAGAWDQYHVATPSLVTIGAQTYLYHQGAGQVLQPYGDNHWSIGIAAITLSQIIGGGHPRWRVFR